MTSLKTERDVVLPGEEDLDSSSFDDDEDDEDEENDDVLASASPSTSSAGNEPPAPAAPTPALAPPTPANTVTIALPAIPNGGPGIPSSSSSILSAAVIAADPSSSSAAAAAASARPEERKPMPIPTDDSRKLFQRLWTDEDEIELLQGFLDYSTHRGGNRATHHGGQNDTALFYDQIKNKLQLEFNKNQLVEKLRRLKKKYRNVVSKMSTGKEFSFKSPHDQATFEISRKIWTNIGGIDTAMDDDDPSPSIPSFLTEVKGEDFAAAAGGFAFERRPTPPIMATPMSSSRPRKRSRLKPDLPRTDERRVFFEHSPAPTVAQNSNNYAGISHNHSVNGDVRGLIEETVRNCLSPFLKELSASTSAAATAAGGPSGTARGFGGLTSNTVPMSYGGAVPSVNLGMFGELAMATAVVAGDERWRRQQVLELEVYSKRLELVQDQIRAALDDLRSKGGS